MMRSTRTSLIALLLMVAFGFSNMTIAAAAGKDSSGLLGEASADTTISGKEINTNAADSEKPASLIVDWALPWPDFEKPLAGFPVLHNIEHFDIFTATPDTGTFNHGSGLYYDNGIFYALWDNHIRDEDWTGTRVMGAISHDGGRNWSKAFEVFPPPEPPLPRPKIVYEGRHVKHCGIFRVDDKLYVHAIVRNLKGKGTTGSNWTDLRQELGLIARRIMPDGSLGDVFLYSGSPIEAVVPGYPSYLPLPETPPGFPDVIKGSEDRFDYPRSLYYAGRFPDITKGVDGHVLCEHTMYQRPDGTYVTLSRDLGLEGEPQGSRSCRLYAAESKDGRTWSASYRSNIPDLGAKSVVGHLPDGTVYLINTPVPIITGDDGEWDRRTSLLRDPLVISLSKDGRVFDRAAVIRSKLTKARSWKFQELKKLIHGYPYPRYPGRGKDVGVQYPFDIIVDDVLYVMYSIHKEDIGLSRIPLSELKKLIDSK